LTYNPPPLTQVWGQGPEVCFAYLSDWFAGFQFPARTGLLASF